MLKRRQKNLAKTCLLVLTPIMLLIAGAAYSKDKNASPGRNPGSQAQSVKQPQSINRTQQNVGINSATRPQMQQNSVNTTRSSINTNRQAISTPTRNTNLSVTKNSVTFSPKITPGISQQSSRTINTERNTIARSSVSTNSTNTQITRSRNNVGVQPNVEVKSRTENRSVNLTPNTTTSSTRSVLSSIPEKTQRTVTVSKSSEKNQIISSSAEKANRSSERMINTIKNNQSISTINSEMSQRKVEQRANVTTSKSTTAAANERINNIRESINQRQQEIRQKQNENPDRVNKKISDAPTQTLIARADESKSASVSDRMTRIRENIKERQAEIKDKRPENLDRIGQRLDKNQSIVTKRSDAKETTTGRTANSERLNQLRERITDKQNQLRKQRNENLSAIDKGSRNTTERSIDRQPERRPQQTENTARIQKRADEIHNLNLGINRQHLRYMHDRHSYKVIYYDSPRHFWSWPHNRFWYFNPFDSFCYVDISSGFYFGVGYSFGNSWCYSYVYPYYHRKYVFVSLGGYWPYDYYCARYYWYGWHPYRWYGYYPVAREVAGDTYNYYTYNYYSTDIASGNQTSSDQIPFVDENTFADVRAKLAQQAPASTIVDTYFDEGVKAFEVGAYGVAADKFGRAMELAPEDMVLPFAYAQALISVENYIDVAKVLREALVKVEPDKETVFFPRGLYSSDDVLFEQIDKIAAQAKMYPFDADLQLILGYQLLGIGETEQAFEALQKAAQDQQNADAAVTLLEVLDKINTLEIQESDTIGGN